MTLNVGDVDRDGAPDLIFGNPITNDPDAVGGGVVFVFHGPDFTRVRTLGCVDPDSAFFGSAVGDVGDINGDGFNDLVVGDNVANGLRGRVWVLWGPDFTSWKTLDPKDGKARDNFGASFAVADFDGDGVDDLAVSEPGEDFSRGTDGQVHVFFGPKLRQSNRIVLVNDMEGGIWGGAYGTEMEAHDENGDGLPDLLIGANRTTTGPGGRRRQGEVDIRYAPDFESQWSVFGPPSAGRAIGLDFALGDVNGDGKDELALGAPVALANGGQVFLADLSSLQPFTSTRSRHPRSAKPKLALSGEGTPTPGESFTLIADGVLPGESAWLASSDGMAAVRLDAPGSVDALDGARFRLVADDFQILKMQPGSSHGHFQGRESWSRRIDVPNDPTLYGLRIHFQAFATEPSDPAGFRESNGVTATLARWPR